MIFLFQLLTIHLDESDVFSAWVSAKELGFTPQSESVDTKCKPQPLLLSASIAAHAVIVQLNLSNLTCIGKKKFCPNELGVQLHIAKNIDKWLNEKEN